MLVALVVFLASLWYFAPGPLREWPIPPDSMIIGYFGNGAYLATRSSKDDFSLSYWDAATGRLLRQIPNLNHPFFINNFSPDGQYLAHVVRERGTLQVSITNLLNDQQDQHLVIPLHEAMQRREKDKVYLWTAWSPDSRRLMFIQEEMERKQMACLWDIQNRKLIFQQKTGIYNDPNIIVRFNAQKNNYVVVSAVTGQLIAELPVLATESEFEFSATPDGSAFMVIGSSELPKRLVKYRFNLKTLQLSTLWEKDYGSDNHHIRYETFLRPSRYYLFRPSPAKSLLLHAENDEERELPQNAPLDWTEKSGNSISYTTSSMGNGPGLIAVDGQGTRIISSDGRYLIYETAEPVNSLLTKLKDWVRTRLGIKIDTHISIVQLDLYQEKPLQYFDFNNPGPLTLILSPDDTRISLIDKRNDQLYLRQWAVPFPTYPWLLMLLISCLSGLLARFSPILLPGRSIASTVGVPHHDANSQNRI